MVAKIGLISDDVEEGGRLRFKVQLSDDATSPVTGKFTTYYGTYNEANAGGVESDLGDQAADQRRRDLSE